LNGWNHHNKCIKLFNERKQWSEAKNICESNNATLVSIHSREENDFVWDLIKEKYFFVWIGSKRNSNKNRFEWINGKAFYYTNWRVGQPNGGDYVGMHPIDGKWFHTPGIQSFRFICEYSTYTF
jgi:hypothetical protein